MNLDKKNYVEDFNFSELKEQLNIEISEIILNIEDIMGKILSLNEQAQEILKIAQEHGVEQNFFFITTFKRYQVQINILNDLESKIKEDGSLVTKEYVKGRGNLYTHPAISEYNKTSTSANQTVATLIKIIKSLRNQEDNSEGEDELLKALGIN